MLRGRRDAAITDSGFGNNNIHKAPGNSSETVTMKRTVVLTGTVMRAFSSIRLLKALVSRSNEVKYLNN